MAKSQLELKNYFKYYKLNSADYWRDLLSINTENFLRSHISADTIIYKGLKYIITGWWNFEPQFKNNNVYLYDVKSEPNLLVNY